MSFGNQWRVLRQYLSLVNMNNELEKLLQKIRPVPPEEWDNMLKHFDSMVKIRYSEPTLKNDSPKDTNISKSETKIPEKKLETPKETLKNSETIKLPEKVPDKPSDKLVEKISQDNMKLGSMSISFETLLQGLRLKRDLQLGKISDQDWRTNKPIVSKTSIHSRTAYVISAIVNAESSESTLKRTENFIVHLKQYPEARDYAIKEGGVRVLLRALRKQNEGTAEAKLVLGVINEALALLGYNGPSKGPGPNILSIDGGGIRGVIVIEILKNLERITGKRVTEMFDYIIGVSTGAIIAAVLTSGVGNLEAASEMYHTMSKKMFGETSVIGGTSRLVWSQSYYDTEAWEKLLQENLNDIQLTQCNRVFTPKMALVSCVVNSGSRLRPYLFRTYEMPYRVRSVFPGTSKGPMWQAVRASAAAPMYFQEFKLDGLLHQDGGIIVNNPAGVGLHEARLLFGPESIRKGCLISIGTGQALAKPQNVTPSRNEPSNTSWKDKFNKILDSATDTEGTHYVLNDLLPPGSYFRFNPPLNYECAMDEIDPTKINSMIIDTQAYIRRNKAKMAEAGKMLTRKRSVLQKLEDCIEHQLLITGMKTGH